MANPVYKVLTEAAFSEARGNGHFTGSADDLRDGFIHLSAAHQLEGTLAKHFARQDGLMLLALDPAQLGPASAMGGVARRRSVPASLRAARSFRGALGRTARALGTLTASTSCRKEWRMNGLFGFGQSLLLALDPERAHELAVKSLEFGLYPRAPMRPTTSGWRSSLFGLDFPKSDRHGRGLRQGRARAARAARAWASASSKSAR